RDLAQAQLLMTGRGHQADGGLQRRGFQIAMAIGRPARLHCHASFIPPDRPKLSSQADARRATRSSPYCSVIDSPIMLRIILITVPLARALVAAWAAMLSVASFCAASSALRSSASGGTTRSKKPAVTASVGPNISAVITTLLK